MIIFILFLKSCFFKINYCTRITKLLNLVLLYYVNNKKLISIKYNPGYNLDPAICNLWIIWHKCEPVFKWFRNVVSGLEVTTKRRRGVIAHQWFRIGRLSLNAQRISSSYHVN